MFHLSRVTFPASSVGALRWTFAASGSVSYSHILVLVYPLLCCRDFQMLILLLINLIIHFMNLIPATAACTHRAQLPEGSNHVKLCKDVSSSFVKHTHLFFRGLGYKSHAHNHSSAVIFPVFSFTFMQNKLIIVAFSTTPAWQCLLAWNRGHVFIFLGYNWGFFIYLSCTKYHNSLNCSNNMPK